MKRIAVVLAIVAMAAMVAALSGCGGSHASASRPAVAGGMPNQEGVSSRGRAAGAATAAAGRGAAEKPVARRTTPSGDIPDSQVFVTYASSVGGYQLDVPEGWARRVDGTNVRFTFDFDGLSVKVTPARSCPTASTILANQAQALDASGRAVTGAHVIDLTMSGEPVVLLRYESNSAPNSVTNKEVRLENDAYFYFHNGRLAELRLWAPAGSDNVDQWRRISNSFTWRVP